MDWDHDRVTLTFTSYQVRLLDAILTKDIERRMAVYTFEDCIRITKKEIEEIRDIAATSIIRGFP